MEIIIEGPLFGTATVCTPILRALPEWFGSEAAILQYSGDLDDLPTFLARDAKNVFGFLSLKQHNRYSAELYVMGVRPEMHRHGIGQRLVQRAQDWLMTQGVEYLQVKTLGPSNDDPGYARTRAFYLAMGFRPLEEFKQLWDAQNPCLILVKRL